MHLAYTNHITINLKIVCETSSSLLNSDTLFKEDFSLLKFTVRFSELQAKDGDSNLVLSYQCKEEGKCPVNPNKSVFHNLRVTPTVSHH